MSDLSPDAFRQVERDAYTKIAVATGTPQALFAWFLRQGWKVKFVLAAILMFLAYAAASWVLDLAGLRPLAGVSPANCGPSMPTVERARCIVAQEEAEAARTMAANEKLKAEFRKAYAEREALEREVTRQRNLAIAKALKEEFDRRLTEFVTAVPPETNTEAKQKVSFELQNKLFAIMQHSDHPLNAVRRRYNEKDLPVNASSLKEAQIDLPGWRETMREIDKSCTRPLRSRLACAEAIKSHILKLSFYNAVSYINYVVSNTLEAKETRQ